MQYLIFGLLTLAIVLFATQTFASANPVVLARQLRVGSGVLALVGAGVLMLRGMASYALWLAALGSWLLAPAGGFSWRGRGGAAGASSPATRVVTEHLDVELEHDSGMMSGVVLKGPFKDRRLEELRPSELARLWADCEFSDPQSARIIEAYLDRVHPTWRDDMARAGAGGEPGGSGRGHAGAGSGTMSRKAALDVLGLGADASDEDIRRAHHDMMLRVHPDKGGSHALASAVNEARDVLLGEG